jgi:hypothetical protein
MHTAQRTYFMKGVAYIDVQYPPNTSVQTTQDRKKTIMLNFNTVADIKPTLTSSYERQIY